MEGGEFVMEVDWMDEFVGMGWRKCCRMETLKLMGGNKKGRPIGRPIF